MKFLKKHGLIAFWLSLALGISAFFVWNVNVFSASSLYNIDDAIVFDLSKGKVSFTDTAYSGFGEDGAEKSGDHNESNIYVIMQSNSGTATNNVVSVGTTSTAVTKKFEIHLRNLNIDAPKTVSNHAPAIYVNTDADTVYLILDNGTSSKMQAYAHLFKSIGSDRKGSLDDEAKRFGHAAIEKEIDTKGALVITCENGYKAYLADSTKGHNCSENGDCGYLYAKANAEAALNTSGYTRTAAAAAIGSKAEVSNTSDGRSSLTSAPTMGIMYNLTIAGGRIRAEGGKGNFNKLSAFNSKKVYLGGSPGIGVGAGLQQYSIGYEANNLCITGGYIDAVAGDGSSANIGGGYHAGYVTINIHGGTIIATAQLTSEYSDSERDMKRGAGIGGGGGGSTSNATAGATVNIYGGDITAYSSYGAAIGAGGGG